jgi:2-octaprenylphenol hydroxylase
MNKRLSFPLSTMQSSAYTESRIALIGDAAHTIHPMAGLGVNSGIMDSMLLANNIIRNIKTGNDIGDLIALGNYEAKAKIFNYSNSLAMEAIKKTF